ncbi:MAG: 4Fe-4S binding protein [bacterium]
MTDTNPSDKASLQHFRRHNLRIGELLLLVKYQVLQRQHIKIILAEQKISNKKVGEILVEKKLISSEDLKTALAVQHTANGRLQKIIQLCSAIISNSYIPVFFSKTIYQGAGKGWCVPFLHCYACPLAVGSCPIGTLQHFAAIKMIPYYVLGYIGLIGITIGRWVCGWLCPFGYLQDLMYNIKSKKFKIPVKLTYLKYIFLAVLVFILPYFTGIKWFSALCPNGALIAGIPWVGWNPINPLTGLPTIAQGMVNWFYWLKIGILVFFLMWFILAKRPFCRTACPFGAVLAPFNHISMLRLHIDKINCNECNVCKEICPVDISVFKDPNAAECIRCMRCTACPSVRMKYPLQKGGDY